MLTHPVRSTHSISFAAPALFDHLGPLATHKR